MSTTRRMRNAASLLRYANLLALAFVYAQLVYWFICVPHPAVYPICHFTLLLSFNMQILCIKFHKLGVE